MITQMPRGSYQLSLQRTGGDLDDVPASHGSAPYSRIRDATISHCLTEAMDMAQNQRQHLKQLISFIPRTMKTGKSLMYHRV